MLNNNSCCRCYKTIDNDNITENCDDCLLFANTLRNQSNDFFRKNTKTRTIRFIGRRLSNCVRA